MGKILGVLSIIAGIVSLFLHDSYEDVFLIILGVMFIVCALQTIRNVFGDGILEALLILIISVIIGGALTFGITFLLSSFSSDATFMCGVLIYFGGYAIYNSVSWSE